MIQNEMLCDCDVLQQSQVVARVEDLQQNGIDLELMHMSPSDRPFDIQTFYKVFHIIFSVFVCTIISKLNFIQPSFNFYRASAYCC